MYQPIIKEFIMNQNQIKGEAKDIGGKIQQEVGELIGSSKQQAKGPAKNTDR